MKKSLVLIFLCTTLNGQTQTIDLTKIKAKIDTLWLNNKLSLTQRLTEFSSSEVLYNTQAETINLLIYSYSTENYDLLKELCELYLLAYNKTVLTNQVTYSNAGQTQSLSSEQRLWLDDGYDSYLNTTAYIFLLARTLNYIATIPNSEFNLNQHQQTLQSFVDKYNPIVQQHLNRWIQETKPFQMGGYGCIQGIYSHQEFLTNKMNLGFGNSMKHCNAIEDWDIWIVAAASDILSANFKNPSRIELNSPTKEVLLNHVDLGTRLIKSRIVGNTTTLTDFNGNSKTGLVFDRGAWSDHPDFEYAGVASTFCQPSVITKNPQVGYDISHSRKWFHAIESLFTNRAITGQSFPDSDSMHKLANQFLYGVFNKNLDLPLFSNFFDGSNGWYRNVNLSWLSDAAITGGFCLWEKYNPDFGILRNALYKMIMSNNDTIKNHYKAYYGNYYPVDGNHNITNCNVMTLRNFDLPNAQTNSLDLLQFLPTFFTVPSKLPVTLFTGTNSPLTSAVYSRALGKSIGNTIYGPSQDWHVIAMTTGDFDGNGNSELISAFRQRTAPYTTNIYRSEDGVNPGGGSGTTLIYTSNYWTVLAMTTGDFDGNGKDELITAFKAGNEISVYYDPTGNNPGGGGGAFQTYYSDYWSVTAMTTGNFGLGHDILLTAFKAPSESAIYYDPTGKHPGGGAGAYSVYTSNYWSVSSMTTGKFGSNHDVLLTAFSAQGESSIYYDPSGVNPGGGGASICIYPSNNYWKIPCMATGDFDENGIDELVISFEASSENIIYSYDNPLAPSNGYKIFNEPQTKVAALAIGKFERESNSATNGRSMQSYTSEVTTTTDLGIHVYPNPSTGTVKIETSDNRGVLSFNIYSMQGEKLFHHDRQITKELEVAFTVKGMYIIRIFDGVVYNSYKILIE